jgi:general secretion pathway protein E
MVHRDIGQLLLQQKKITQEMLNSCYEQAGKKSGKSLLQCLGEHISAQDIAQAMSQLLHIEYIEKITDKMADPGLLAKVPLKFLRTNLIMPVMANNTITLVVADPYSFQPVDELRFLLGGETVLAIATPAVILDGINRYYPLESAKQMIEELEEEKELPQSLEFAEIEEKDILSMATEAPIIKLVNHILVQAVKRGASDIHIEPFEKEVRVRYRVDGIMYTAFTPPKRVQAAFATKNYGEFKYCRKTYTTRRSYRDQSC